MVKVAIQGVEGAFHGIAAREYFKHEDKIEILPCNLFKDVIAALKKDPSLIGIIAIENTIAGSLLQNHELIRESDLSIIGEKKLHISHCLAALPEDSIHDIVEINSHPIALMQCADFLETQPNIRIVEKEDTAVSALNISQKQLRGVAAICSKQAAKLYGLNVLSEGIETNKRNFTRFLLIANHWTADDFLRDTTLNKSSLVFTLPHTEGSLSKILTIFSFYDINLTKIQSLPIIGREWEYMFYVDLAFNNYMRYKQAIDAVLPLIKDFKILGEYEEEHNK